MPQAQNQEERDIERRCKAWSFKIAGQSCYVVFHKLPHRTIGKCFRGLVMCTQFGMRTFQRNVIVLDLEKAKKHNDNIEELIIHECLHIKIDGHPNEFAVEMKKWTGHYEWGSSVSKASQEE